MLIIHRYIFKEITKFIALVLTMVVSIYLIVDYFERVDNRMEAGFSFSKALTYFIFKIPFIITQILPLCILLGVLSVFGIMTKRNEMTALKASGISPFMFLKPIWLMGLICAVLMLILGEYIVPLSVEKSNFIWLKDVKHKSAVISKEKNIWLKEGHTITNIKYYNKIEKAVYGITIYFFDQQFQLKRRIDAFKGVYHDYHWKLFTVMEQVLNPVSGDYKIKYFDQRMQDLKLEPTDFNKVVKKAEEMNFKELYEYIRKIEAEGYDATTYRVDLYGKTAQPLICLIISLVGAGIALRLKSKDSLPMSITYGLGASFLFFLLFSFCMSMGYGGMLPPLAASQTANLLFTCLAAVLLLNIE